MPLSLVALVLTLVTPQSGRGQTPAAAPANREVSTLIKLLEAAHYNRQNVAISRYPEVIEDFMAELDGQRLFFLETDRRSLTEKFGKDLYRRLATEGNVTAASEIFQLYCQRLGERVIWIQNELAGPTAFTTDESYHVDRASSPWLPDRPAADELWRRRLKFELLAEMMNDQPPESAKAIVARRYQTFAASAVEVTVDELTEQFLSTVTHLFDASSVYYSPKTHAEFASQLKAVNLGFQVEQHAGNSLIKDLDLGGPAEKSGEIRAGDRLVSVAEENGAAVEVFGLRPRRIESLLRGAPGSPVRLVIEPAGQAHLAARKHVVLHREDVTVAARARAEIASVPTLTGTRPIGLVRVAAFYGVLDGAGNEHPTSSAQDVAALVQASAARGVQGIVLDLRGNGGGYLTEAIEIAGLFLGPQVVAQIRNYDGTLKQESSARKEPLYSGPLVVLVDDATASGAEIVAGALQAHGRAVIVGGPATFGTGTIQVLVEMKQLSRVLAQSKLPSGAAKITTQKAYLPNGSSPQGRGITPDIVLPSLPAHSTPGAMKLKHALPWDKIPVTLPVKAEHTARLAQVRTLSERRQTGSEEFTWLRALLELQRAAATEEVGLKLDERARRKTAATAAWERLQTEGLRLGRKTFDARSVEATPSPTAGAGAPASENRNASGLSPLGRGFPDLAQREALRVLADWVAAR